MPSPPTYADFPLSSCLHLFVCITVSHSKGKGSPCSIAERRVPELIPVLGSQPAGDVSHKPGGRLPLLSARPALSLATLVRPRVSPNHLPVIVVSDRPGR